MDPPDSLNSVHSSDADPLDHGSPIGPAAHQSDEHDPQSETPNFVSEMV